MTFPAAACHGPVVLDDGYQWAAKHASFQGSYVDGVTPRVWEDGEPLSALQQSTISTVSMDESDVLKRTGYWDSFIWADQFNEGEADYWYTLKYCTGHWPGDVQDCKL